MKIFERFEYQLCSVQDFIKVIVDGEIGKVIEIDILQGCKFLIYVDYVVLGCVLCQVEEFVMVEVLFFYVNLYIEQSYCGVIMIQMCEEVCVVIVVKCCVNVIDYVVIFGGFGVMMGLN